MIKILRAWFRDSETILWARLQMLGAAVVATIAAIDHTLFASYIPTGYLPIYIFVSGIITEFARRLRDNQ